MDLSLLLPEPDQGVFMEGFFAEFESGLGALPLLIGEAVEIVEILYRLIEREEERICVLCDLETLTIGTASKAFWSALGRPGGRNVPFIPLIHPEDREDAKIASESRPLSGDTPPVYLVRYLHSDGLTVQTAWTAGVVPEIGKGKIALFFVEVLNGNT